MPNTQFSDIANGRIPTGVGLAARVALSAHALNNEGTRGNAQLERRVQVVALGDNGSQTVQYVNAISGDSVKHTFVDYLRSIALDQNDAERLPICEPCRRSDPNRLNADLSFQGFVGKLDGKEKAAPIVSELIRRCVIDDVAGILVTAKGVNAPRHSTVQFGWQVGIPDLVETGRYTHVKLVPGNPEGDGAAEGSNTGQNIFTRPASSGLYAMVSRLDLRQIGLNDVSGKPEIGESAAAARRSAAIQALYHTVASPDGAQTNTQLPHLQAAQGAVSVTFGRLPAPIFSPLADQFVGEMVQISEAFGRTDCIVLPFNSVGSLSAILADVRKLMDAAVK